MRFWRFVFLGEARLFGVRVGSRQCVGLATYVRWHLAPYHRIWLEWLGDVLRDGCFTRHPPSLCCRTTLIVGSD